MTTQLVHSQTFAEQPIALVPRSAQRTQRCNHSLTQVVLNVGGEVGVRVLRHLGIVVSGDTLLRLARKGAPRDPDTPRHIGVDDWAWKRGHNYGTLIVDLDRQCPIDILPDRDADTLVRWLLTQPQIELISRDRSATYAEAARRGAPQAQQVVDRWHLLKNLREALEVDLEQFRTHLQEIILVTATADRVIAENPAPPESPSREKPSKPLTPIQKLRLERREHWLSIFHEVHRLWDRGLSSNQIAAQLDINPKTVRKYVRLPVLPEKTSPKFGPKRLDPYQDYIRQRLQAENISSNQMYQELKTQGYSGSKTTLWQFMRQLKLDLQLPPLKGGRTSTYTRRPRTLTARSLSYLVFKPETQRTDAQKELIQQAHNQHPLLGTAITLVQSFHKALCTQQAGFLDHWLQTVANGQLPSLQRFAQGLHNDPAVALAFVSHYSNGQTEGQVNRLKLIKRQMYGRAKFDLLRLRVLYQDQHETCG